MADKAEVSCEQDDDDDRVLTGSNEGTLLSKAGIVSNRVDILCGEEKIRTLSGPKY